VDPAKIAADAQRLSYAGKIALPAVVANAMNQDRLMRELNAEEIENNLFSDDHLPSDGSTFISSHYGNYEFTIRMIEERLVARNAMKAPPKTSALNGNVNVTQTREIANELLNEMQRNAGNDKVIENLSRYLVTVHRADGSAPDWKGEVIGGPPALNPSRTVTTVSGGSSVMVLDKSNKKLWEGSLTHKVMKKANLLDDSRFGAGPCVEHDGRLYVCDEAMLTAFDLASGNVHWRLPTVGIAGIWFDENGMLYVNSTTADMDSIKFSKHIDIDRKITPLILKIDPRNGKTLWTSQAGSHISYMSGKFIYVWSANEAADVGLMSAAINNSSYVRIKRIDPGNGRILWDHFQPRSPLDVKFNENTIQLVFENELQVLRYLTF
jgi:outer membrane protein assembly factor BamB